MEPGVPAAEEFETDEALFAATIDWAEGATLADLYRHRALVLQMMDWGLAAGHEILDRGGEEAPRLAHQRWRQVIELGRTAELAMSAGGRHGAWEQVLVGVEKAARADVALSEAVERAEASEDESHEVPDDDVDEAGWAAEQLAWALHQRGTRALLRDELKPARELLNKSLAHRRSEEGQRITKRNLILLPLAVLPFALLLFIPLFIGAVAVTQISPFDESSGTADITPDSHVFGAGAQTQDFEVRNLSDGTVWVRSIDIEGDSGGVFTVDADAGPESCRVDLAVPAGQSCTIAVSSTGDMASTAILAVAVHSRAGRSEGDQSTVLVSRPGAG